jgi:hypothetical protein
MVEHFPCCNLLQLVCGLFFWFLFGKSITRPVLIFHRFVEITCCVLKIINIYRENALVQLLIMLGSASTAPFLTPVFSQVFPLNHGLSLAFVGQQSVPLILRSLVQGFEGQVRAISVFDLSA